MSNAIAIVGLFAQPNPLVKRSCNNESIIIHRKNSFVELFDCKIEIETDGCIYVTAADNITEKAGQNISAQAGQNISETAGQNINEAPGKDISEKAWQNINAEAGQDINLKCINLTVEASGEITFKAPKVIIEGDLDVKGDINITGDIEHDGDMICLSSDEILMSFLSRMQGL